MAEPIIATSVSDIPQSLDGYDWIIEPENPKQLAETIQYVYEYPIEAKEKGLKAREKCKREYSWNAVQKCFVSVFNKLNELTYV